MCVYINKAFLQIQSWSLFVVQEEHQLSLSGEQSKVAEVEERLQQQALREEQLVTSLENKLSGLSKTVGDYERQHDQDKTTIQ